MAKKKKRAARRPAARRKRKAAGAAGTPLVILGQGSTRRVIRGTPRKGRKMAKKRRSVRRRRRGSGVGGGGRGALGGFLSRDTLAAVGGATAAAFFGPMIGRLVPVNFGGGVVGNIAGSMLVAGIGYLALRRVNRTAALAFVASSVAPTVIGMIGQRAAGVSGYASSGDGIEYYPQLQGGEYYADDAVLVDDGLGEYSGEYYEVE